MNRIFQIGFNKCGTLSIHNLFNNHTEPALKSLHWENGTLAYNIQQNIDNGLMPLDGYESINVFTDMEAQISDSCKEYYVFIFKNYKFLDKKYPNSRFILNTRNINNWIISRLNHKNGLKIHNGRSVKIKNPEPYYISQFKMYNIDSMSKLISIWENEWHEHHLDVMNYFRDRSNDLLVFDIETDSFDKFRSFFYDIDFTCDSLPISNNTKV